MLNIIFKGLTEVKKHKESNMEYIKRSMARHNLELRSMGRNGVEQTTKERRREMTTCFPPKTKLNSPYHKYRGRAFEKLDQHLEFNTKGYHKRKVSANEFSEIEGREDCPHSRAIERKKERCMQPSSHLNLFCNKQSRMGQYKSHSSNVSSNFDSNIQQPIQNKSTQVRERSRIFTKISSENSIEDNLIQDDDHFQFQIGDLIQNNYEVLICKY